MLNQLNLVFFQIWGRFQIRFIPPTVISLMQNWCHNQEFLVLVYYMEKELKSKKASVINGTSRCTLTHMTAQLMEQKGTSVQTHSVSISHRLNLPKVFLIALLSDQNNLICSHRKKLGQKLLLILTEDPYQQFTHYCQLSSHD